MPSAPIPFRHRLVGRLLLFGLLPTVGVVIAGLLINANRTYRAEVKRIEVELGKAARIAAAEVELELVRASTMVEALSLTQSEGGLFGRRGATVDLLRAMLAASPAADATFVVYETNADGNDAKPAESGPREALAAGGRFAAIVRRGAGPERAEGSRLEALFGADESSAEGLVEAKRRLASQRGRQALFLLSGTSGSNLRIEVVRPILRDGRLLGIVGATYPIRGAEEVLAQIGQRLDGEIFLVTDGGAAGGRRFVATTVSEALAGRDPSGTRYAEVAGAAEGATPIARVFRARDASSGGESLYTTVLLPGTGWTLVARRPTDEAFAQAGRLVLLNTLTGVGGLVIVALLLTLTARGFSRRLELVVASANRIATGDLSQAVPESPSRDETKLLLDSFRDMSESLNRIVGQVRHASISINSTATELAATARQQEETVAGFSASTTQVAAATREITTTGEELLETIGAISVSATGAAEKAEASRTGLVSMQEAMRRLDDAANSVASRLATISEKAQGINAIVGTITKVADQTNLLSVNAAIEAEKAGEFGVGFLVVAREIRRLADQTATATLDIERMVRQMQGAVASGVMEMDRFGETLRSGATEVGKVGERLEGIIAHVEHDVARIGDVNEGMRSQSEGVRQIDDAMRQLAAGAKQTAQAAGDFGKAAGDLQESIAGLKTVVAQIRLRN